MAGIRLISTSTVQAATQNGNSAPKIELTPWDIQLLLVDPIQKGLLFHPKPKHPFIQHLKASLSSTLDFFAPLAGRLSIVQHEDNTSSFFIICNNSGALFVHAVADDLTVADILQPIYTPRVVHSFFQLNGVRNYEGTSKPLLAVQITELVDGLFIGCTINHTVADGSSFWHFFNAWAEISRGLDKVSRPPSLQRWFLQGISRPMHTPFTKDMQQKNDHFVSQFQKERVFHFTKQKIAELKAKANSEAGTTNISSLQALLTHLWRSIVRNQRLDPQEEVNYRLLIGVRPRMSPPLPANYFGVAVQDGTVTMKAGELLEGGGLGKVALEMNKMVVSHSVEKLRSYLECWLKKPTLLTENGMAGNALVTSSSPRFDVYGNDFGWGKPVAVRSGAGNKTHGKITVFAGAEEGSIDIEICLSYEILEAMTRDSEFTKALSSN